jgi:hypothetical protein
MWSTLALIGAAWLWGWGELKSDWLSQPVYILTAIVLHVLIKGFMANEASRTLADERQQGTLELLLSTPLSITRIVSGHRLSVQRLLLGPFTLIVVADIIMMFAGLTESYNLKSRSAWVVVWISGMIVLVADLIALFWVGMWQGLTARDGNRASGNALSQILFLPWVIYALLLMLVSVVMYRSNISDENAWVLAVAGYLVLSLAVDVILGNRARLRLLLDFREMATRRYERKTFWRSLFSR